MPVFVLANLVHMYVRKKRVLSRFFLFFFTSPTLVGLRKQRKTLLASAELALSSAKTTSVPCIINVANARSDICFPLLSLSLLLFVCFLSTTLALPGGLSLPCPGLHTRTRAIRSVRRRNQALRLQSGLKDDRESLSNLPPPRDAEPRERGANSSALAPGGSVLSKGDTP